MQTTIYIVRPRWKLESYYQDVPCRTRAGMRDCARKLRKQGYRTATFKRVTTVQDIPVS